MARESVCFQPCPFPVLSVSSLLKTDHIGEIKAFSVSLHFCLKIVFRKKKKIYIYIYIYKPMKPETAYLTLFKSV